jgi:Protein of unknown function (DUF2934)
MAFETEDRIRVRAYHLWEASGRPEGRDQEFWEQARRSASEGEATAKAKRRTVRSQAAGTTAASSSKRSRRSSKSRTD